MFAMHVASGTNTRIILEDSDVVDNNVLNTDKTRTQRQYHQ